jgi:hypothetical protein
MPSDSDDPTCATRLVKLHSPDFVADNLFRHIQVQWHHRPLGHRLTRPKWNSMRRNIHGGNRFFPESSFPRRMKPQRNSHDQAVSGGDAGVPA